MNTPGSEEFIFGLTGPETAALGILGVAAYYFGKRMFSAVNGTSN